MFPPCISYCLLQCTDVWLLALSRVLKLLLLGQQWPNFQDQWTVFFSSLLTFGAFAALNSIVVYPLLKLRFLFSGRMYFHTLYKLTRLHRFFFPWHISSVCWCGKALCLTLFLLNSTQGHLGISLYSCLTIIPRLGYLAQPSCVSLLLTHVASSLASPPE